MALMGLASFKELMSDDGSMACISALRNSGHNDEAMQTWLNMQLKFRCCNSFPFADSGYKARNRWSLGAMGL